MNLSLTHLLINKYLPPSTVLSVCEYLYTNVLFVAFKTGCDDRMMPILYLGGYSEMDGLKLTCEFTFNKKEKKETFKLQSCRGAFTLPVLQNVLSCAEPLFHTTPPWEGEKKKNGRCGFKKLNCPLACARRCDWWARRSPWRRSWKQELLLTVCGSSQTVWLPFRKVALCPAQNRSRAARTEGLGRRRNVTYVLSGTNNDTDS